MRRIDWLIGLAMLVGMFSCSVTKNLPDDEILYTGIDKVVVQEMDSTQFGEERSAYLSRMAKSHLEQGRLKQEGGKLILTEAGIFVSDGIMSDLLWV